MKQLSLPLLPAELAGRHCLPLISEGIERMLKRGILRRGMPFYCLKVGDYEPVTWSGRGQRPAWVRDWLDRGRSIKEIEATV